MWGLAALQTIRLGWGLYQRAALQPIPPLPEAVSGDAYRPLTIIIPARNEKANIASCLAGARAQAYNGLEIIVVDDRSEDTTPEIVQGIAANDGRVRLIEGQPLPEGWKGKCWALHQGSLAARGEWLLFVDADTRLLPGAAAGAMAAAQRHHVYVLSAVPAQELASQWERIIQPAVFAAIAEFTPVTLVNSPRFPGVAIAVGQFLLVRKDAYLAIGGHAAIRDEIAEDAQFAKRTKQLGWAFWLGDGRDLAQTRMYTSLGDLWEGWTKNLHVATRLQPWVVPPGIALLVLTLVAPWLCLFWAVQCRSKSLIGATTMLLGTELARRRAVDDAFGVRAKYMFAQPLGQLALLALLTGSFYKVMTGQGVTWKGRRYSR